MYSVIIYLIDWLKITWNKITLTTILALCKSTYSIYVVVLLWIHNTLFKKNLYSSLNYCCTKYNKKTKNFWLLKIVFSTAVPCTMYYSCWLLVVQTHRKCFAGESSCLTTELKVGDPQAGQVQSKVVLATILSECYMISESTGSLDLPSTHTKTQPDVLTPLYLL